MSAAAVQGPNARVDGEVTALTFTLRRPPLLHFHRTRARSSSLTALGDSSPTGQARRAIEATRRASASA